MSLRSQFRLHKSKLGISTNRAAIRREKRKLIQAKRESKRQRQEAVDKVKMPPPPMLAAPKPRNVIKAKMPPPPPVSTKKMNMPPPAEPVKPVAPARAPASVPTRDYRTLLREFYVEFNPTKVGSVDSLLRKYRGKEGKLLAALCKKYPGAKLLLGDKAQGLRNPSQAKSPAVEATNNKSQEVKSLKALLPTGFFDDDQTESAATSAFARGSVAHELKALEGTEEEVLRGNLSQEQVRINPGTAIPVGFFDDKKADAVAHNIDPKVLQKQAKKNQWEQFQKFAESVQETEKEDRAFEEINQEERDHYEEMTRKQHMCRVSTLKRKWKTRNKDAEAQEVRADTNTANDDNEDARPSFPDVIHILQNNKKKKQDKLESLRKKVFTPLNPLDWRLKNVGAD